MGSTPPIYFALYLAVISEYVETLSSQDVLRGQVLFYSRIDHLFRGNQPGKIMQLLKQWLPARQALNFELAKNKTSYGKFCGFMLVKISFGMKIKFEMHC